ncbi:disulfide bond formation protein B [Chelatococcus asaccharovorans]|uniref:disulfide bond formation protein B n=1 Tax=Chelatococcus asaccharovorans TaxID=28210 RepID=UPI00224C6402|nr:disulfide bond formation protein B [Chelatococcus asaccharovorans]CAH1659534.1 Periplasmic thiol:disulfide oxidoreductase DsbB, required for DsbA reoxidation [Chelatococcus asaccharovorans]CAH1684151.1 Periplasmic thiol:disulfide oxidoreductase DsbB, required for DsbA reoxidation [Chelatococcus asaccharovorans]
MVLLSRPRLVALAILVLCVALIGGAYYFEYGLGLMPCELCLKQRQPYYLAMPVAAVLALLPDERRDRLFVSLRWIGFGLIAVAFLYNAGLGVYHSGAEWHLWQGPADCTGPMNNAVGLNDFLKNLQTTRVVRCDEAAWRFLGVSLAGWSALASLGLALLALGGLVKLRKN